MSSVIQRKLADAIEEFLVFEESAATSGTVNASRNALRLFLRSTGDINVRNVHVGHVDAWLNECHARKVRSNTVSSYTTRLRAFCRWARNRKLAPANWDPVGPRRISKSVPLLNLYVPVDRFGELLDAATCDRDRAMMAFGLYTLARISEMRRATVGDIDLQHGWIDMEIQKSSKRDRMPMSIELHHEMQRWLSSYARTQGGPLHTEWRLFPPRAMGISTRSPDGRLFAPSGNEVPYQVDKAIHGNVMAGAVKDAVVALGYDPERVGGHTLRRSAARARFDHLRSSGYDGALRDVQALLHHSSSRTTETYLGLDLDVVRRNESILGRAMYGASDGHQATSSGSRGTGASSAPGTRRLRVVQ